MMSLQVIIQLYLHMDKLDQAKHLQCLDLIGMIIFNIRIQWQDYTTWMEVLNLKMDEQIHFCKTNKNMV